MWAENWFWAVFPLKNSLIFPLSCILCTEPRDLKSAHLSEKMQSSEQRCSLKEKWVKLLKEKGLKIRYPLTWREFFKGKWTPNQICSLIFLSFPLWFFQFSTFELHNGWKFHADFNGLHWFSAFFAENTRLVFSTTRSFAIELSTVEKLLKRAFQRY